MKTRTVLRGLALCSVLLGLAGRAEERLPTISPDQYTDEQKKAAAEFLAARKMPVFGPFEPLMYSPELMNHARALGDYLRFHSAIGPALSEFAILVTARAWSQDYEWYVHAPLAIKAGVAPRIAAAIADGRRPEGMSEDQEAVFDFLTELNANRRVSDASYARAEKRFGRQGVVDLTGLDGYYTMLAMLLNVARYPVPKDGTPLVRMP